MKRVLLGFVCSTFSACGGCSEPPRNLPPPAQKAMKEAMKNDTVRGAAYGGYKKAKAAEEYVDEIGEDLGGEEGSLTVTKEEIQGALVALVNRALVGLDAVKSQVEALEIDYQQFKASVGQEFEAVWTKVNRIDQTLEEFVPAVNLRFESLESRVDKLEQRQGMTYRRRRAE